MEQITLSKADAEGILSAIKKHESARDDFTGDGYSDEEWNGISALVVAAGRK